MCDENNDVIDEFFDAVDYQKDSSIVVDDLVDNKIETSEDVKPGASDDISLDIDEEHLKELESLMNDEQKQVNLDLSLTLKDTGNDKFKAGEFKEAIEIYTNALKTCPTSFNIQRAVLYSNRAAAQMKLADFESAIIDCSASLKCDETFSKALFRRAMCYEQNEDMWHSALNDYQTFLQSNPGNPAAMSSIHRLRPLVDQRNEKMKTEMIDKLKDLGNVVLRPFGLSTDHFKMEQNADGGFNIKMQNN